MDHTLQLGVYTNSVWLTHFIFEHFEYIIPQPQAYIVSAEKSDVNLIEMPLNVTNLFFFLVFKILSLVFHHFYHMSICESLCIYPT